MSKLEETNKLIEKYNEDCLLTGREKTLFDIAKSLAIIADELLKIENKFTESEE